MEKYNIPFYQKSSLKWYMNLLASTSALSMGAFSLFFFLSITKDDIIIGLSGGLFSLILSLFFAYIFLFAGVLKRFYIEITSEYIKVFSFFKPRLAYWRDIHEFQIYEVNNNLMIALMSEKDIKKAKKRSLSNSLNSLLGSPGSSFPISLNYFKEIDVERLLLTIDEQINNNIKYEVKITSDEEYSNSMMKALATSTLLCIISGIFYGFTIYELTKNFVVIPIFGSLLIIAGFNKYYLEKSFNLTIRILLGLICFLQVPIAIIGAIIMPIGTIIPVKDIFSISNEYFQYLVRYPFRHTVPIVIAIICFSIGVFKGRTNK